MEPKPTTQGFLSRLQHALFEETDAVVSRRALAHLAVLLPTQAFARVRTALLRQAGMRIGNMSLVQGPFVVTGNDNPCRQISIGTFTIISGALHCDVGAAIRIGNRVRIGHDVSLLTVDHQIGPEDMRSGLTQCGPIEIGDGAWLASRVVVLPGVRIGAGAIVAAGSVVTKDVPPNTLVVGVPARVTRSLKTGADLDGTEPPVSSRRFLRQA